MQHTTRLCIHIHVFPPRAEAKCSGVAPSLSFSDTDIPASSTYVNKTTINKHFVILLKMYRFLKLHLNNEPIVIITKILVKICTAWGPKPCVQKPSAKAAIYLERYEYHWGMYWTLHVLLHDVTLCPSCMIQEKGGSDPSLHMLSTAHQKF